MPSEEVFLHVRFKWAETSGKIKLALWPHVQAEWDPPAKDDVVRWALGESREPCVALDRQVVDPHVAEGSRENRRRSPLHNLQEGGGGLLCRGKDLEASHGGGGPPPDDGSEQFLEAEESALGEILQRRNGFVLLQVEGVGWTDEDVQRFEAQGVGDIGGGGGSEGRIEDSRGGDETLCFKERVREGSLVAGDWGIIY